MLNICSYVRRASATVIHPLKDEGASLHVYSYEGISNRQSGVRECYNRSVLAVNLCEAWAGGLTGLEAPAGLEAAT